MKKYNKFVCKHQTLVAIIYSVLAGIYILFSFFCLDMNLSTCIINTILISFIIISHINSCQLIPNYNAIKSLDMYCDPYPLLETSKFLMECKNSKIAKIVFTLNYCTALHETGEFEKAIILMQSLKEDVANLKKAQLKFVYYCNLSSFYSDANNLLPANESYNIANDIYKSITSKKVKKTLHNQFLSLTATNLIINGDYQNAISVLDSISKTTLRPDVSNSLYYAKACIALGYMEKAKDKLMFVITNGNKLACVNVAHELFKETPYASYSNLFSKNNLR